MQRPLRSSAIKNLINVVTIDTANTYGTIDYDIYCPRGLKVQLYDGTAADITVVTN
jgi:hypothetical protein